MTGQLAADVFAIRGCILDWRVGDGQLSLSRGDRMLASAPLAALTLQ